MNGTTYTFAELIRHARVLKRDINKLARLQGGKVESFGEPSISGIGTNNPHIVIRWNMIDGPIQSSTMAI